MARKTVTKVVRPVVQEMTEGAGTEMITGEISSLLFMPPEERVSWWRDPRIRILWYDPTNGKWVSHGFLPIDEAGPDFVSNLYGGGKWQVQVVAHDDGGKQAIRWARQWLIPGAYKPPTGPLPGQGPRAIGEGTTGAVTGAGSERQREPGPGEALNIALASQVLELVKGASRGPPAGPATNWEPLITGGLALVTTIVTKMMDRAPGGPDPLLMAQLRDVKTELAALKVQPTPAANAVTDILESIERIVKVSSKVRKLAQGDDEPKDPESAMWEMGKKALEAMTGGGGGGGLAGLPGSVQGAPGPVAPSGGQPRPLWEQMLVHHGRDLVQAAARGVDPGLAADWTINMIPSDYHGVLIELLRKPDCAALVTQVVPPFAQYPQWLQKFIAAAQAVMLDDDGPESEASVSEEIAG